MRIKYNYRCECGHYNIISEERVTLYGEYRCRYCFTILKSTPVVVDEDDNIINYLEDN